MKLKEKLNEKLSESFANEIEQIADEFAIGFAEWCLADFYISLQTGIDAKADTIEQLLEIYKKERGL